MLNVESSQVDEVVARRRVAYLILPLYSLDYIRGGEPSLPSIYLPPYIIIGQAYSQEDSIILPQLLRH